MQIYDTDKDVWMEGTPLPGTPVFGHAGAIIGDTIIYVDGAYKNPNGANPKYVASTECWMGKLPDSKKGDVTKIRMDEAARAPRQRALSHRRWCRSRWKKNGKIYFSGGSDNPYNYNGIGYNRKPSEPSPVTFAFNTYTQKWETINENTPIQRWTIAACS